MNLEVLKVIAQVILGLSSIAGYILGARHTRKRMLSARPPKAPKREDETVLVHEGIIDGDALRFTLRTRTRIGSYLIPKEIVYQMSDDLLRAAAQLGKRVQPQQGPES